jgi:hypothetical protein
MAGGLMALIAYGAQDINIYKNIYLNLAHFLNDNEHLPLEVNDNILYYYIINVINIKTYYTEIKVKLDINDNDLTKDIQKILNENNNHIKKTKKIIRRFNEYKYIYIMKKKKSTIL